MVVVVGVVLIEAEVGMGNVSSCSDSNTNIDNHTKD